MAGEDFILGIFWSMSRTTEGTRRAISGDTFNHVNSTIAIRLAG